VFGNTLEYVHPDNKQDAIYIEELIGQKTINILVRCNLTLLSNQTIVFEEVLAP
jgi:hypothetical protein